MEIQEIVNNSATARLADEIIRIDVDPRYIGEQYLAVELHRLFKWSKSQSSHFMHSIEALDDVSFYRLLEAFSFTYRLNGVFYRLGSDKYVWVEAVMSVDAIDLTGINPSANQVIQSDAVHHRPKEFARYLGDYFTSQEADAIDPGLGEFIVDETVEQLEHEVLYAQEKNDQVRIFDGSHRLIAMAQLGIRACRVFIAIPYPDASDRLAMRGAAIFLHLRQLYESTESEEAREHIVMVCRELVRTSKDGRREVTTYWVQNSRNDAVRNAANRILADES